MTDPVKGKLNVPAPVIYHNWHDVDEVCRTHTSAAGSLENPPLRVPGGAVTGGRVYEVRPTCDTDTLM